MDRCACNAHSLLTTLAAPSGLPYADRVLETNPIAYWIQGEAAGATSIDQILSPQQDGTYTGVTLGQPGIGDGNTSPLFDGINDYNNIFTAAFQGRFNGSEGTVMAWARVLNAGVWTDGTFRRILTLQVNSNNNLTLYKTAANNVLQWYYEAGGVTDTLTQGGISTLDWINVAMTWSATVDEVRMYYNGAQILPTQVGLGVWAGALAATTTVIGASNTTPAQVWNGFLAHIAVWDTPLPPATVSALAVV